MQGKISLLKKYDTRDPYELCKCLESKLKGFFFYQSGQKNIIIDSNVNDILERILVAHELGHAVLHAQIAMMKNFRKWKYWMASQLYVPAALPDYKFNLLHEKGEPVNPMYIRKSDFLKDDLGDYDDTNHFEYE